MTVDGRHVGFLQSASRTLSQAWGDSGYTAWSNARVISPTAPKPTAVAQVQLSVLAYPTAIPVFSLSTLQPNTDASHRPSQHPTPCGTHSTTGTALSATQPGITSHPTTCYPLSHRPSQTVAVMQSPLQHPHSTALTGSQLPRTAKHMPQCQACSPASLQGM